MQQSPTITLTASAVPAFIGFTQNEVLGTTTLLKNPTLIASFASYEWIFGKPQSVSINVDLTNNNALNTPPLVLAPSCIMYYAVQLYFANGGGPCYIVSAGTYPLKETEDTVIYEQLNEALKAAGLQNEITLLVLADATLLAKSLLYYDLQKESLTQCATLKNRFSLLDTPFPGSANNTVRASEISAFRNGIGNEHLQYGAAYFPWLHTSLPMYVNETDKSTLSISGGTMQEGMVLRKEDADENIATSLYHQHHTLYTTIKSELAKTTITLPPSFAVAGVITQTDGAKGVWKAPAGTDYPLKEVKDLAVKLNETESGVLNVDAVGGKSINVIRTFAQNNFVAWGARTLAGNDPEWKYVPVRRFCLLLEESIKKGLEPFIVQPNDSDSWIKIDYSLTQFLMGLWKEGALQGPKSEQAFWVKTGRGRTMTEQDIEEGRLIVEIGVAVIKPAEFIVLKIILQMAED